MIDIIDKAIKTRDRITELLDNRGAIDLELEQLLGSEITIGAKEPVIELNIPKKKRGRPAKIEEVKISNGKFDRKAIEEDLEAEVAPDRICEKHNIIMSQFYNIRSKWKKNKGSTEADPTSILQVKIKHYRKQGLGVAEIAMTLNISEKEVEEAFAWLDK